MGSSMHKIATKNLIIKKKSIFNFQFFFLVNILNMNGLGAFFLVENMCQMFLLDQIELNWVQFVYYTYTLK